jgi:transcriptional regulator GlxA family with amidase domain
MLFENTLMTVKEVAAAVGAGDVSHFARDYKTLHSQTASNTRRSSARQRPMAVLAKR